MNDYGVDWDNPCPTDQDLEDHEIVVPTTSLPLNPIEAENLQILIDPLKDSEYHGVDIYMDVLCYFQQCFQAHEVVV